MTGYYESPIGWLELTASQEAVRKICFLDSVPASPRETTNGIIEQLVQELSEYFDGKRTEFSLCLQPEGTPFQKKVWKMLKSIPYGQTVSYGQVAEYLGNSQKMRAVGRANGQNPIPILIPCHRVVGAEGHLVGYGGGIIRKRFLLRHEGALLL
ncbi:methylated-DNA--[protein]-cysteine S-methyltransferase [Fodinibius sediminis]|uniref:Methylated-DNA--protein-cysteine methyltransferase n=1 Tax=Fodinibius sediminis TaxID=1214077 RepID=A0A521D9F1_9BACT|nr:methylated-DNA--[protein]-cysteine S-methyltransferase [Fodinibius sediminis]SMO68298.1 methylated-DNA-[protein]-cysteine S-methyltransferase [Fodinibius sediminis]